jgi:hypothetical protein
MPRWEGRKVDPQGGRGGRAAAGGTLVRVGAQAPFRSTQPNNTERERDGKLLARPHAHTTTSIVRTRVLYHGTSVQYQWYSS